MTNIAIKITEGEKDSMLIKKINMITDIDFMEIVDNIHKKQILKTYELFTKNFNIIKTELSLLIQELQKSKYSFELYSNLKDPNKYQLLDLRSAQELLHSN